MYYQTGYVSPIGKILLESDGENLTGLWLEGQKYYGGWKGKAAAVQEKLPVFDQTRKWLDQYFAGKRPEVSPPPLLPEGSGFQKAVWRLLCEIPYGTATTYGAIAEKLAEMGEMSGASARAVGSAVGRNPISVIIPCHRVVGKDGTLRGYAGGIGRKLQLLMLEGVDVSRYIEREQRPDTRC